MAFYLRESLLFDGKCINKHNFYSLMLARMFFVNVSLACIGLAGKELAGA